MIGYAIVKLVCYDIFFLAVLLGAAYLLAVKRRAAYAVLKRNFMGYFANPTGYVFLCLFVLLTSMAAFWPHEFFSDNIGSLGQLNRWFVYIMLFFIPAITMSIWAEERRQGTDELLLTLPADDFDIVIGKYTAAVAIFTTSLLFSQISTFIVLLSLTLGEVDTGLFFVNYLGYWFIGLAMFAVGMVASFLTNNLTVGFILGALFNAPLAFAGQSDVITGSNFVARRLRTFSLVEQFDNFGRGVLSSASILFFVLVAVLGLYLCMVLVGRRHWSGSRDGQKMFLHYLARTLLLVVVVVAGSEFLQNFELFRFDATEGQVSSLSPTTRQMIKSLEPERPIVVDAFLSSDMPEAYTKVKYEVISLLKEFEATASRAGVPIDVRINGDIERRSEEEEMAREQFGIQPRTVQVHERGVLADRPILLGAAFRSGLEKVVVPFFELGVPVEYQLIQAMNTVSRPARKKLGVLRTDAQLTGGFSMTTMSQVPRQAIMEDFEKQYDIVEIDPTSPIDPALCDVLLAVQPSSLNPEQMENFVAAVAAGIPTAIFEDPAPLAFTMPGTGEPKQAGNPMFGGGQPVPKGDIRNLWKTLQIEVPGKPSFTGGINPDLVWQRYNPYPMLEQLEQATPLWIFIRDDEATGGQNLSDESEITAGLEELMFLHAGAVNAQGDATYDIIPLAKTIEKAGLVSFEDANIQAIEDMDQIRRSLGEALGSQTIAVLIQGESAAAPAAPAVEGGEGGDAAQAENAAEPATPTKRPIHAVYVADADCMSNVFVSIRNQPDTYDGINFRMQNITFALNVVDVLAGELDYPKVRRHVPSYTTLRLVEQQTEAARIEAAEQNRVFNTQYTEEVQTAEAEAAKVEQEFRARLEELQEKGVDSVEQQRKLQQAFQTLQAKAERLNRSLEVKKKQLELQRDAQVARVNAQTDREIRDIQNYYKMLAVFIPPIPPLLVGVMVFVSRRLREREGIAKSRLK